MSSVGGQTTAPGFGAYCATKFAHEGLTETLRDEVAGFGIVTLIVEPGAFRTGLFRPGAVADVNGDGVEFRILKADLLGLPRERANLMATAERLLDDQPPGAPRGTDHCKSHLAPSSVRLATDPVAYSRDTWRRMVVTPKRILR